MRFNAALVSALYSSAALVGSVRAADADVDADESSSTVIEESTTSSVVEKPTFTVSPTLQHEDSRGRKNFTNEHASPRPSKHLSLSSSQTTGNQDGSHPMPRKKIPRPMRIGRMLESGQ